MTGLWRIESVAAAHCETVLRNWNTEVHCLRRVCRTVPIIAMFVIVSVSISILLLGGRAASAEVDALSAGFRNPPASARPHVWWHWMNGYVDADEAQRDLEWMWEAGIGGVQLFEAGLGPPAPADERVVYGTSQWRTALKASLRKAAALDLDFAITTSPGWSATGGPWVDPEDAMKKLVWSTTQVTGGRRVTLRLTPLPSVAGPFQDIPAEALGEESHLQPFSRAIVTLAMPIADAQLPAFDVEASVPLVDADLLHDGDLWPSLLLKPGVDGQAWLTFRFTRPVTLQSVTVGMPGRRGFGAPAAPVAELQYSQAGNDYHQIIELPAGKSLVRSASFEPVEARYFRILVSPNSKPGFVETLEYAPGTRKLGMPAGPAGYRISEVDLGIEARVHRVEEKAGFAAAADYYEIPTPGNLAAQVRRGEITDISRYVRDDGVLEWDAPPGRWRIIRLGYSLTGKQNGPAPPEATGLEVDKLSGGRVADYMKRYLAIYADEHGELLHGITGLLSDSIESGPQNWSEELPAHFENLHGYDPLPWLATVAGVIVDSPAATDRFLWDFRKAIESLLVEAHYETLANVANANNLTYYAEALEDHRPQLGNDLDMRSTADVPMGAFWHHTKTRDAKSTYVMDVKGASSVANLLGKQIVAVEAMTTFGHPWAVGPKELKPIADEAFLAGGNRLMLHSSVHQASGETAAPGQSMMPLLGHYFNRNVTWSGMAAPWVDYLSRTQFLLQQGRYAADFAYFIGEEAPVTGLFGDELPGGIPDGFQFDFVSASALQLLAVDNGMLTTESGMRYRFLFLGGSSRIMTLKTLERIADLAGSGAIIVGQPPTGSPSLADDDEAFESVVRKLWALPNVINLASSAEVTTHLKMSPAWLFAANDAGQDGAIRTQVRRLDEGDLYFVVNSLDKPISGMFSVQSSLSLVDIWLPVSGKQYQVETRPRSNGYVDLDLKLAPYESVFILLRDSKRTNHYVRGAIGETAEKVASAEFDGQWLAKFDSNFGDASELRMNRLLALSEFDDPGIRHYSGVTTYSNTVTVRASDLDAANRVLLSFVDVCDIATVHVNGRYAGSLWTPPYEIDLRPYLEVGSNDIEIRVANYWANRLIGLARTSQTRPGFPDGVYEADAPLRPAGLIGPASIAIH